MGYWAEEFMQTKGTMLSSTVIPVAIALGVAGAIASDSVIIKTAQANPCAVKKAVNPCAAKRAANPCAAKKACNPCAAKNPCNPCAAKRACNPCAAKNPCNPCGANPCNPCAGAAAAYSARCAVPRLQKAALCNPCAAKKACNPCAAKNPCNPCGGAAPVELSAAEAQAAYDCIITEMKAAYAKSGIAVASSYSSTKRYSKVAYQSATHGGRFVQNYANETARAYGRFEKAGRMPEGSYLFKDSFTVTPDGKIGVGPLFVMRKMGAGWNTESGDWKYAMVMPNGSFFGETKGRNAKNMKFCIECHMTVAEEQDSMLFLPEEYR